MNVREKRPFAAAPALALAAFLALFTWNYLRYVQTNGVITSGDPISHFILSLKVLTFLQDNCTLSKLHHLLLLQIRQVYPPVTYLAGAAAFHLFGISWNSALASLLPFHLLLAFAVYLLGARLAGPGAGAAAALLTATSPLVANLSRYYFNDIALTAMVMLCLYLLMTSEYGRRRGATVLFGVAMGVAMLTKWAALIYLLPALTVVVAAAWGGFLRGALARTCAVACAGAAAYWAFRAFPTRFDSNAFPYTLSLWIALGVAAALASAPRILALFSKPGGRLDADRRDAVVNLGDAAALAVVVASPWYLFNTHLVWNNPYVTLCLDDFPRAGTPSANLWYLVTFFLADPLLLLVLVPALALILSRKAAAREHLLLLVTLAGSYVLISAIHLKFGRYLVPLIPMSALVVASALSRLGAASAVWLTALLAGPLVLLLQGELFTYPLIPPGFSQHSRDFMLYVPLSLKLVLIAALGHLLLAVARRLPPRPVGRYVTPALAAALCVILLAATLAGATPRVYDAKLLHGARSLANGALAAFLPPGDKLLFARPLDVGEVIPTGVPDEFVVADIVPVAGAQYRVLDEMARDLAARAAEPACDVPGMEQLSHLVIAEVPRDDVLVVEPALHQQVFIFNYFFILRAPRLASEMKEITTTAAAATPVSWYRPGCCAVLFYRSDERARRAMKSLRIEELKRYDLPVKGCRAILGRMR